MHALAPLRNKSLLMLGDSTDANVWARLCHCPRRRNKAGRTRQEENAALAAGACGARSDTHVSCLGVDYVFVLAPPATPAAYMHLAGRTARSGRRGVAVSILRAEQAPRLVGFAEALGVAFRPLE